MQVEELESMRLALRRELNREKSIRVKFQLEKALQALDAYEQLTNPKDD